jgi:Mor family transcriptional regulator
MHYARTRRADPSIRRRALEQRAVDMRADYEIGMSTTEIGAKYGLDSSHVSRVLRAAGTTMRPFGGSRLK